MVILELCLILQALSLKLVAEKENWRSEDEAATLAIKDLVTASVTREVQQFSNYHSSDAQRSEDTANLTLLTSFFYNADHAHWAELAGALHVNVHNPFFGKVHILMESPTGRECDELQSKISEALNGAEWSADAEKRLTCVPVSAQPTYGDFFDYANSALAGKVVVLANTDVAFDDTLGLIDSEAFDTGGVGYVLSVQPPPYSGDYSRLYGTECDSDTRCTIGGVDGWRWGGNSWDVYVFHSPLQSMESKYLDHFMNNRGGENRAAYQLEKVAGVPLSNPCKHIHAFHWHCSGGDMHAQKDRVDRDAGEHAVQGILPCWDCPGMHLPKGKAPLKELCARGSRKPLRNTSLHLDVIKASCTSVCMSSLADAPKGMCQTSDDVDCIISECGATPHGYY